jgi:hypothetical protein
MKKELKIVNETLTWQQCHEKLLEAGKIKYLLVENCIFSALPDGEYWYIDKGNKKNFGFCGVEIPADHFIARNKFTSYHYNEKTN